MNTVNPAWLTDPTNSNYVAPELRDPNAVKMLSLWPAPNSSTATGTAQFTSQVPAVNNTRQEVVRIDYDIASNWKLVGRYTHDLSETVEPGGLFTNIGLPNISATHTGVPGQVAAFELRSNRGSALNELKLQFSTNRINTTDDENNRNTAHAVGCEYSRVVP